MFQTVRLVFRVFVCIFGCFLVNSAICTTDLSTFTCSLQEHVLFIYLARQPVRLIFPLLHAFSGACAPLFTWLGNLYDWFFRFYMLLQERVLLTLPGSATCTTDFSDFSSFYYGFRLLGWGQLFSWISKTIYFPSCSSWKNKVKGWGKGLVT